MKRNYPFNCWWVAASAAEVTRAPLCRWLLEQRVVLYRTEAGAPVALEDRCAHRWGPLSQGKLIGDEIACPYHGFRYGTSGACTLVPTQPKAPAALKVRSFPVREHGTFVWVWLGDPDKADPALLPEIPWFTDQAYFQVRGEMELRCNYMLVQENILDWTHVAFLHSQTQQEGWQAPPEEVKASDRSVSYVLTLSGVPAAPFQAIPMDIEAGKKINRREWNTFASPAFQFGGTDIEDPAPASGKRSHFYLRAMHCMTPITPNRCHYWWALAQDYGEHLPDLGEMLKSTLETVFKQDQDVLEAIQTTIDEDARGDTAPEFLVATDRVVVAARRIVKKMLDEESRGSA